MGLKGVLCDADGEAYSFDECLACARAGGPRRCDNPLPLLVAMSKNQRERKDAGISATMLLDCPRKVILMQEEDYYEKPSSYWARFRGTIGHLMMEAYGSDEANVVQEIRFRKSVEIDGVSIEITGKADWTDLKRKLLIDFKSTKSINRKPIKDGLPKEDHPKQVSIYRWLMWGGVNMETTDLLPEMKTQHIEIDQAGILYFDMSGTKKVAAPLWSLDETEAFIIERLRPIVRYRTDKEMPPLWMNERGYRHVLCDYCALREACDARQAATSDVPSAE
jgi:hypothetical protein